MLPNSPFAGAFERVVFAINDQSSRDHPMQGDPHQHPNRNPNRRPTHGGGAKQRPPCLPEFVKEIGPLDAHIIVRRGLDTVLHYNQGTEMWDRGP